MCYATALLLLLLLRIPVIAAVRAWIAATTVPNDTSVPKDTATFMTILSDIASWVQSTHHPLGLPTRVLHTSTQHVDELVQHLGFIEKPATTPPTGEPEPNPHHDVSEFAQRLLEHLPASIRTLFSHQLSTVTTTHHSTEANHPHSTNQLIIEVPIDRRNFSPSNYLTAITSHTGFIETITDGPAPREQVHTVHDLGQFFIVSLKRTQTKGKGPCRTRWKDCSPVDLPLTFETASGQTCDMLGAVYHHGPTPLAGHYNLFELAGLLCHDDQKPTEPLTGPAFMRNLKKSTLFLYAVRRRNGSNSRTHAIAYQCTHARLHVLATAMSLDIQGGWNALTPAPSLSQVPRVPIFIA